MFSLIKAIAVLSLAFAAIPANAGVVNFSFSATERVAGGTILGTVTGQIFGLSTNGANQAATDIVITSYPTALNSWFTPWYSSPMGWDTNWSSQMSNAAGAPLHIFPNSYIDTNSFTLIDGQVTNASFYAYSNSAPTPYTSFALNWYGYNFFSDYASTNIDYYAQTVHHVGGTVENVNGFAGVTYSSMLAPVPEPETYAMLLAGLGLVGFTARRRNKNIAA